MMSSLRIVLRREACRHRCRYFATDRPIKQPIISCKRTEFNHFKGQSYNKFDGIPLASQGWLHEKSKGDHFTVYLDANKKLEPEEPIFRKTFQEVGISLQIEEVMARQGFVLPTLIQSKAIPSVLAGNNTIIAAETGCGKTYAYLLPIMQNIIQWKQHMDIEIYNSPLAVIISPSRELAKQIGYVATELAKHFNVNVTTLIGGHTKRIMLNPPMEHCDILVTTLGAFSKLVTTAIYKTREVHHVVLDEADTLLDDSFSDKLSHVMKKFSIQYHSPPAIPPSGCQLTLASATMPVELPEAVSSFVNPESIKKVTTSQIHRVMAHVPQKFLRLGKAHKPLELLRLVKASLNQQRPVMVFSNKSDTCDWVSMFLNESNVKCININGRMNVDLQMGVYEQFRSGSVNVLSCTDIASRGLDTTRVKHIINYDFPLYTADYIHRCGRTGRLGSAADCSVTNFIAWPREVALVQKIEMALRKDGELPSVNANIRRLITNRINNFVTRDLNRLARQG